MFPTVNPFEMFKPGSGRRETAKLTREPIRKASNFTKVPCLEMAKEGTVHIKQHAKQQNEYYPTYSLSFLQKIFKQISNIIISNYDLYYTFFSK